MKLEVKCRTGSRASDYGIRVMKLTANQGHMGQDFVIYWRGHPDFANLPRGLGAQILANPNYQKN